MQPKVTNCQNFLGNPLAKAFPPLGSGYPLQILPAAAGAGFPFLSLLQDRAINKIWA